MPIEDLFSELTEEECWRIFSSIRWPHGIRCIKCDEVQNKIYSNRKRYNRLRYYCKKCNIWWSDFTGTIFERKRLSLKEWFRAIYFFLVANLSAIAVADKLSVNRNTAQSIRKLIRREEEWCRIILNRVSAQHNQRLGFLLSLKDVRDYLGMSRRSIYRFITSGALVAIKTGGRWRFKPEDVQRYLVSKLSYYGTTAIKQYYFFSTTVLDKYRKNTDKYYLLEEAYRGRVGSKEDYYLLNKSSILGIAGIKKKDITDAVRQFAQLNFRKVISPEGQPAIAVKVDDFMKLTPEEDTHWRGF